MAQLTVIGRSLPSAIRTIRCRIGRRSQIAVIATVALTVGGLPMVFAMQAQAAAPRSVVFASTGAEQSFVVPAGATSLRMRAVGAPGGRGGIGHCASGTCPTSAGGLGEVVDATFAVCGACAITAGQTLYVEVGGAGGSGTFDDSAGPTPGGFNGGGPSLRGSGAGGGGASDVQTASGSAPATRLTVAGGGGGGGSNGNTCGAGGFSRPGGPGGSAGYGNGNGGGTGAQNGCYGAAKGGGGGQGASQFGGGAGGIADGPQPACNVGDSGDPGTLAQGGSGRWESNFTGGRAPATGGGGGGGGYYGGGGGAGGAVCGSSDTMGAGGGGGGSSNVNGASTFSNVLDASGTPMVQLTTVSASSTALDCQPSSSTVGNASTCTATVTDTDAAPITPGGTVTFTSSGAGSFDSTTCTLTAGACSVTFTPTANAGGIDVIGAAYGGDFPHTTSSATANLLVSTRSTGSSGTCTTATVGQASTCMATVADSDIGTKTVPTGTVSWSGSGGTFSAPTCALSAGKCSVTYTPSAVGTVTLALSYGGDSIHDSSAGSVLVPIGQGTSSISISNLPSAPIFGGSFSPTYTQVGDGVPSVSTLTPATCSVSAGVVSFAAAGSCSLRAAASATTNYTAATGATQTIAIAKAASAIAIASLPVVPIVGGSFSPTYTQVGDGVPSVSTLTPATCSVSAGVVSFAAAGSCSLRAAASATANYTAATGATQSVTILGPPTVTQDPTDQSVTARQSVTFQAAATSDSAATVQWQVSTDGGAQWTDLTGATTVTLTFVTSASDDGSAYRAVFTSTGGTTRTAAATLTVNGIPLTITASSTSLTYGDPAPTITPIYGAFANGDSAATVVLTAPVCSTPAGPSTPVGVVPTGCSAGTFNSDYAVSYLPGAATVTPAQLTVTATNITRLYGQANPTFAYTVTGFLNGDLAAVVTGAPDLSTTANLRASPDLYPITVQVGSLSAANYMFTTVDGTLTVTQAALTITASDGSLTYGDTSIAPATASYSGFVNGDTEAALTSRATCTADVATQSTSCAGAVDPNYDISYRAGILTINPAALTVTASDASMMYGGSLPTVTASYSGFVNGDTEAALTSRATCTADVATQSTLCSGAVDSNYAVTYLPGTLTVDAVPLMIIASDASMITGGALPTVTPSYVGLVNGDTAASLTQPPVCTANIASETTSCSGAVDPNYAITYLPGILTSVPPALTVTTVSLAPATVGAAYAATLHGTGGDGRTFVWSLAPGSSLPPGLHLAASGRISGTPNVAGDFTFTVSLNDPVLATLTLSVKRATAPLSPAASPAPAASLASTGENLRRAVVGGGALLLLGSSLLVIGAGRRRRRA